MMHWTSPYGEFPTDPQTSDGTLLYTDPRTCSNLNKFNLGPHCTVTPSPTLPPAPHPFNIFKLVHYEARWQTGASQLSCYIWFVVCQHLRVIICVFSLVRQCDLLSQQSGITTQLSEFCESGSLSSPTVRDTYRVMSPLHIIIVEKYEGPAMTDQASNKLMQNAKRTDTDR